MKKVIINILFGLYLVPSLCFSQDMHIVDSLENELAKLRSDKKVSYKRDTTEASLLNLLGRQYISNEPEKALIFFEQLLDISEASGYKKGVGLAYNNIGVINMGKGDYPAALEMYAKALVFFEKAGFRKGIFFYYINTGLIYYRQSRLPEALANTLMALKLAEEIGDKVSIASTYNNIGAIYTDQGNYSEAIKYQFNTLRVGNEINDNRIIESAFNNIGLIQQLEGNYIEAKKNYLLSLEYSEKTGDKKKVADSYISLASLDLVTENYPGVQANSFSAIKIHEEIGDRPGLAACYHLIGIVYAKQKKNTEALQYVNKALTLGKEFNDLGRLRDCYFTLSFIDSLNGNYEKALSHYKLGTVFRDSVINEENTNKIFQQQAQYDFDKKQDSLNQQHVITATKLTAQRKQRYFYWAGLVMLAMLLFFAFLSFRNQKKINRLATEAHARQKADLELQHNNAVMQERLRISSELHDEVGATLSGIAMYSHLTKEQMKTGQTTEIEKSLNVMQQSSAQMVDKLNDIVWLINPEQDSLQKLIERLEEYATDMAAIKNMKVKITVPDKIAEINLPVDSRRNIYLFCKEAINNAVKYSNASLLELTVKEEDNKLEFSVSDNGKGFDAVMVRRGNGLENMQKRADEIGAKLTLQSTLNEGAYLSLQCKITQ